MSPLLAFPCRLYCLRLALLLFAEPWQRWLQLQDELLPWLLAPALALLRSGWPVFGLLSLIAYKLSRDGGERHRCEQPSEAFLVRYEEPFLEGSEVVFSSDVERTALKLLENRSLRGVGGLVCTRSKNRGVEVEDPDLLDDLPFGHRRFRASTSTFGRMFTLKSHWIHENPGNFMASGL